MALTFQGNSPFSQRDVRETPYSTITGGAAVPVGTILPWLKSFTGTPALPDGYVECAGQVLSDADSVYNGETIPDLNGGIFLRGDTTSGGTGGSDTMAHTHTGTASGTTGSEDSHTHAIATTDQTVITGSYKKINTSETGAGSAHSHSFSDDFTTSAASNDENRPPYYNVVWIMRIK